MVDQTVIEKWWAQLGMSERVALLYYSDMLELKVAAGTVAQASYSTLRREIQEVIENAFLQGREADRFWFGINWKGDSRAVEEGLGSKAHTEGHAVPEGPQDTLGMSGQPRYSGCLTFDVKPRREDLRQIALVH